MTLYYKINDVAITSCCVHKSVDGLARPPDRNKCHVPQNVYLVSAKTFCGSLKLTNRMVNGKFRSL